MQKTILHSVQQIHCAALGNDMGTQKKYWNKVGNNKNFTHPLNRQWMEGYICKNSQILDFGCGYGRVSAELHDIGFVNLVGADTSHVLIQRGLEKYPELKLKTVSGLKDRWLNDKKFDLIVLFAVLTCIPIKKDQTNLIKHLTSLLNPKGKIYVSDYFVQKDTRNLDRYENFLPKYRDYGVFETSDGAVFRHHQPDWLQELFSEFDVAESGMSSASSLNGNKSEIVQILLTKPPE